MAYQGSFLLGISWLQPVFDAMNAVLNPLVQMDPTTPNNPVLTVFVISFIISLLTVTAQKLLVDQDKMNEMQAKSKALQKELRAAQASGDTKEMAKVQAKQMDMMQDQSEIMKMSFRPMIVTMIPILLIFAWMWQSTIRNLIVVFPPAVYYCTLTPLFHSLGQMLYGGNITTIPYGVGWLWWYFICTFGMSQIIRKFMGFKIFSLKFLKISFFEVKNLANLFVII